MASKPEIKIACASAFWGDTPFACRQVLREPDLDFIVFDYLSETTLTTLAKQKERDPNTGYCPDFMSDVIEPHLAECLRRGIRLIANAGAMNPLSLKTKIDSFIASKGLKANVMCVVGDDLTSLPRKPLLMDAKGLPVDSSMLASANAYFGGVAIADALDEGADIVIVGRTVDSALVTAPLVHSFHWSWTDYEKLSYASLAGHLLESGTQVTGGGFTDWNNILPPRDEIGFPIAIVRDNGVFKITKPSGTGGFVSPASIAELLYSEVDDPSRYHLPDVVCDWSRVSLSYTGPDEVEVRGAVGFAPSNRYKVAATQIDGFKIHATAFIAGGDARTKAQVIGSTIVFRAKRFAREMGFGEFTETRIETLGAGTECLLRISAAHKDARALDILAREVAPASNSLAPGMTSLLGGRAQPMPRIKFHGLFVDKSAVPAYVSDGIRPVAIDEITHRVNQFLPASAPAANPNEWTSDVSAWKSKVPSRVGVPLSRIAHTRSSDKGNNCHIAVIARNPEHYSLLRTELTAEKMARFFANDFDDATRAVVARYEAPGANALSFVLKDCLGGGGSFSLRVDPQGRAYGQRLLDLFVPIPEEFANA